MFSLINKVESGSASGSDIRSGSGKVMTIPADPESNTRYICSHTEETWDFTVAPPFLVDTSRKTLLMETPRIVFDKEKMRPGMLALGKMWYLITI